MTRLSALMTLFIIFIAQGEACDGDNSSIGFWCYDDYMDMRYNLRVWLRYSFYVLIRQIIFLLYLSHISLIQKEIQISGSFFLKYNLFTFPDLWRLIFPLFCARSRFLSDYMCGHIDWLQGYIVQDVVSAFRCVGVTFTLYVLHSCFSCNVYLHYEVF